ncbi:MAG: type II toxin-antitoxin system RelE/ParE family toxin [Nitrospinae bacterium]|nr:type II toxin-antitoxin system RelE/ParE family toxin [Nitrospinota bacterium]
MIITFACKRTEAFFRKGKASGLLAGQIQNAASRKLQMLHFAVDVNDLKVPPGNQLEALKGSRKGQYSIRINNQYRICFRFEGSNAYDVEIVDYH